MRTRPPSFVIANEGFAMAEGTYTPVLFYRSIFLSVVSIRRCLSSSYISAVMWSSTLLSFSQKPRLLDFWPDGNPSGASSALEFL